MKLLARFVVVLGAVAIAWVLFGQGPNDVVLVYDLPAGGETRLDVDIRRAGESVRRAEFRLGTATPGVARQVRHAVKLPEGDYEVAWRLEGPAGGRSGARIVAVREDGTILLPIGP